MVREQALRTHRGSLQASKDVAALPQPEGPVPSHRNHGEEGPDPTPALHLGRVDRAAPPL
eukprot:8168353-Pyramimonas_sp.AAC.1